MKKVTISLLFVSLFVGLLSSCDGLEISNNGNLDGFWHLVTVDSIEVKKTADYTHNGIYWSVQDDLLMVEDKTQHNVPCLLRFKKEKNTLVLSDPYIYKERVTSDEQITDVNLLRAFGINKLEDVFSIEKLNKSKFVIKNDKVRLSFIKY